MMINMNVFFLCTCIAFCCGRLCVRETRTGSFEENCCFNYELRNGRCVECENGFFTYNFGEPCRPCSHGTFGRLCSLICICSLNERCDHVNGECLKVLPSTETGTTNYHFERNKGTSRSTIEPTAEIKSSTGASFPALEPTAEIKSKIGYIEFQIISLIGKICILLIFLLLVSTVFVSLTCICWKYELSCKKRKQGTVATNTTHTNESRSNSPQGGTHQYDEVDDEFFNRESSINDGQDVRSSDSSNEGSGICGVDNDGYLNPYNALKSIEINLDQRSSCDQLTTETSFIHAQENIIYFTDQMQN